MLRVERESANQTRVVLIRHAEAVCNIRDTFAGHEGCRGLSHAGHAQGPVISARVRELYGASLPVLVSSEMPRAVQTAEAIATGLDVGADFPRHCVLCERHPGSLDGVANMRVKRLSDSGRLPGDVESAEAFMLRIRRGLRGLVREYPKRTVVAVTHSGVIAGSFWALGGVSGRLPFQVRPDNGSITEWAGDPDGWLLVRYNDSPSAAVSTVPIGTPAPDEQIKPSTVEGG